jgi:hypothetical protein
MSRSMHGWFGMRRNAQWQNEASCENPVPSRPYGCQGSPKEFAAGSAKLIAV